MAKFESSLTCNTEDREKLLDEISRLKELLRQSDAENEQLRLYLQNEKSKWELLCEKINEQLDTSNEMLKIAGNTNERIEKCKKEIIEIPSYVGPLSEDVKEQFRQKEQLKNLIDSRESEIKQLKFETCCLQNKIKTLQSELNDVQERGQIMILERDKCIRELLADKRRASKTMLALDTDLNSTQRTLEFTRARCNKMSKELKRAEDELENTRNELIFTKDELARLKQENDYKRIKIVQPAVNPAGNGSKEAEDELTFTRDEMEITMNELDNTKDELRKTKDELARLERENDYKRIKIVQLIGHHTGETQLTSFSSLKGCPGKSDTSL